MAAIARTGAARSRPMEVRATRDRELLREFLDGDRLFSAYAICDLDDREFPKTRWGVALEAGRPVAVCMEYSGMDPQPLFVMGASVGIEAVLADVIRPRVAYLAARSESLPAVQRQYRVDTGPPMVRMWVDSSSFVAPPSDAVRLHPGQVGDLNRLYGLGPGAWLSGDAISSGIYYGVEMNGRLVAAAGTHVISRGARLAAVGNVLTDRDHRGRGFGKQTTGAVTAELLRMCDQVVLNVRSDNPPALAAYRALGYQDYMHFEERLVHRRGALWDTIVAPLRRWFSSVG